MVVYRTVQYHIILQNIFYLALCFIAHLMHIVFIYNFPPLVYCTFIAIFIIESGVADEKNFIYPSMLLIIL